MFAQHEEDFRELLAIEPRRPRLLSSGGQSDSACRRPLRRVLSLNVAFQTSS
jgi:hypothetical protein